MKALVQRCRDLTQIKISHHPDEVKSYSFQGPGLVVLLGWTKDDEGEDLAKKEEWIFSKATGLRVFPDKESRMNNSLEKYLLEEGGVEGGILWVPQFTLAGKLESGFRPSFSSALDPQLARFRFNMFVKRIQEQSFPFKNIFGSFGADMEISFTNWGPVTLMLDTSD